MNILYLRLADFMSVWKPVLAICFLTAEDPFTWPNHPFFLHEVIKYEMR